MAFSIPIKSYEDEEFESVHEKLFRVHDLEMTLKNVFEMTLKNVFLYKLSTNNYDDEGEEDENVAGNENVTN